MSASGKARRPGSIAVFGPGILVAATGVGAGDLITAAFTGAQLGTAILWAVLVGALMKFVLNEGIATYQLRCGETFLGAALRDLGLIGRLVFGVYLAFWTIAVGAALVSACGVACAGLVGALDLAGVEEGAMIVAALSGFVLVKRGGFALFEKVMSVSILFMFVVVIAAAAMLLPDAGTLLRGLLVPSLDREGLGWTAALLGGVGGTLTILCYGYWIREVGREGEGEIATCRVDLAVGYLVTALFGLSMVIIGAAMKLEGKGQDLLIRLADTLSAALGAWVGPLFLVGSLAAVYSSLLGVWQAVPKIFADWWAAIGARERSTLDPENLWLGVLTFVPTAALAVLPSVGIQLPLKLVQQTYGVVGSLFVPLLALGLLILGRRGRQGLLGRIALLAAVLVYLGLAWLRITG